MAKDHDTLTQRRLSRKARGAMLDWRGKVGQTVAARPVRGEESPGSIGQDAG
jgi:hypothetical protein